MRKSALLLLIILLLMLTACSQSTTASIETQNSTPYVSASENEISSVTESDDSDPTLTSEPTESPSTVVESEPVEPTPSHEVSSPTSKPTTPPAISEPPTSTPSAQTEKPPVTPKPEPPKTTIPPEPPKVTEPSATNDPTPTPFNIEDWTQFAKNYGESIGLIYDEGTTGSWDTPITASASSKYLERDIKGYLDEYVRLGQTWFCVWAEQRPDGKYSLYIGYA